MMIFQFITDMKPIRKMMALGLMLISSLLMNAQNIQDGMKAFYNENYKQATDIFQKLVTAEPENTEYLYHYGFIQFRNGEYAAAKQSFTKGVSIKVTDPLNYVGLGKSFLQEKNAEEAQKNFAIALKITKNKDPRILYLIADAYLNNPNKDLGLALDYANKAALLGKKDYMAFVTLGDIYLEKNEGGPAVTNYEKATALNPTFAYAFTKVGLIWTRAKQYTQALDALTKATTVDPAFCPGHRELSDLYYKSNQYDKAKEEQLKYIECTENKEAARMRLTQILFLGKDYEGTVTQATELVKTYPDNAIIYRMLGYSSYELAKYTEGLTYMETFFTKADPSKLIADDYEYYAKLLETQSKDSLAVVNYVKALETDTSKAETLNLAIAQSYYKQKKYALAAPYYQLVLNRKTNALNYNYLAMCYYKMQQYAMADTLYANISLLKPDAPISYLYRARCNYFLDTASATDLPKMFYEKYIEKATAQAGGAKNNNDLSEAYRYLAFYYYKRKDMNKSKEYFKKVLEVDPKNEQAKKALEQMK